MNFKDQEFENLISETENLEEELEEFYLTENEELDSLHNLNDLESLRLRFIC